MRLLRMRRRLGHQPLVAVRAAFEELRFQHRQGVELLLDHRIDRHDHVRPANA